MHDATEGGILGAVYELAVASGCGAEVLADQVPVRPETAAICAAFGIDGLRLVSSGSMVIAASDPTLVLGELAALGVEATVIGRLASGPLTVVAAGVTGVLEPPASDELYRALALSASATD